MGNFKEWGDVDIQHPNANSGKYLWKYIDLHKLLDFLYTGELHFTRLDSFKDPIEGVRTSLLRQREMMKGMSTDMKDYNPALPLNQRRKLVNAKKVADVTFRDEVILAQKTQFVNCWFLGNRESMAMWEIYSGPHSVALKIELKPLLDAIIEKASAFIAEHGRRLFLLGDKVTYLPLNPFVRQQKLVTIKYAGMKKDESFEHEKEYRLLISALPEWVIEEDKKCFRYKLDHAKLDITIICHPLMEDWQFNNIKTLVAKLNLNFKIQKSDIELRK